MTESNQVKWRGIRQASPVENIQTHLGIFETTVDGVTRLQVLQAWGVAAGTTAPYTVAAGKVLHITSCCVTCDHTATAVAYIVIRDADDTNVAFLLYAIANTLNCTTNSLSFPMPIRVPAGWDIVLVASAGTGRATFQGWLQDA